MMALSLALSLSLSLSGRDSRQVHGVGGGQGGDPEPSQGAAGCQGVCREGKQEERG